MPSNPDVHCFFEKDTNTAQYVVIDPATKACAIIDSVLDYEPFPAKTSTKSADLIVSFVEQQGLKVEWILETHVHADHLTGAAYLKSKFPGAKVAMGEKVKTVQEVFIKFYNITDMKADGSLWDQLFAEGDTFNIGEMTVRVISTPGHTPACVTYVIGDAAFVGDTIFMPDMGSARCDFPGGSAVTLYQSAQKILSLPDETRIFVGHDYAPGGRELAWESTVGEQKAKNKHLHHGVSEGEFVEMRTERDATLSVPRLLLPALQVNIRAGALPPADSNGTAYMRIPLNKFAR